MDNNLESRNPPRGYNVALVQEQLDAFQINNEYLHRIIREKLDPLIQKYETLVNHLH